METVFNYDISNIYILLIFGVVLLAFSGLCRYFCWRSDFELAGLAKSLMHMLPYLGLAIIVLGLGSMGVGYLQYRQQLNAPPPTATPIPSATPIPPPTATVYLTASPIPTEDTFGCIRWSEMSMDFVGYQECVFGVVHGAYPAGGGGFVITFSPEVTDFYFVGYGDWAPADLIGQCIMAYGNIEALGTTPLMVVQPYQIEECTFR